MKNWNRFWDNCNIVKTNTISILIKRNENGIWMKFYHKSANTKRYLSFISNHVNNCNQNIPICLAQRICIIANNNADKLRNFGDSK